MKVVRVANEAGALHCLQAGLIMLWSSLTGEQMDMANAEVASGYRPGFETWPYATIAWLAEHGCDITHVDALDALALVVDPVRELERGGTPPETIDYFLKISDFEAERRHVERAMETGRVTFDVRIPEVRDIREAIAGGSIPMVSLDYGTLQGRHEGFEGHIVIATGLGDHTIVIQDPGPPAHWDWSVDDDLLLQALRYPVDTAGTITIATLR